MKQLTQQFLAVIALTFAGALITTASAATVHVSGDEASADVQFSNGLGVEVNLSFKNVIGLSESALGVSARVVSPTDVDILSRLPTSGGVNMADAFPVLVSIEPPADEGLSFTDAYEIELHTHNLHYLPNSTFRLMKSHQGGPFVDITDNVGAGSVRARGRSGGFSEFMIAVDLRALSDVANNKFNALEARILQSNLDSSIQGALIASLTSASNLAENGDLLGAVNVLDQLILSIESQAGSGIPNIWRSSQDIDNIAGDLVGQAASLRYTLGIANTQNSLGTAIGVE